MFQVRVFFRISQLVPDFHEAGFAQKHIIRKAKPEAWRITQENAHMFRVRECMLWNVLSELCFTVLPTSCELVVYFTTLGYCFHFLSQGFDINHFLIYQAL